MPRSTYYERLKAIQTTDKYSHIKQVIKQIFRQSRATYGYRRTDYKLKKLNYTISPETVRKLMKQIGLKVRVYSKRSHYSSYRGHLGHVAPNILKQKFNERQVYRVLHTDITQLKLDNNQFGYISTFIDEASNEVNLDRNV